MSIKIEIMDGGRGPVIGMTGNNELIAEKAQRAALMGVRQKRN